MAEQAVRPPSTDTTEPASRARWRTVDIVVTAVLGVAFGVVFWAWNLAFGVLSAPLAFFAPLFALLNGVYLMPAVVAGLLVRKPGAAVFASTLAAALSLLFGSPYGLIIVVYGLVQGIGGGTRVLLTRPPSLGRGAPGLARTTARLATPVLDPSPYLPPCPRLPSSSF